MIGEDIASELQATSDRFGRLAYRSDLQMTYLRLWVELFYLVVDGGAAALRHVNKTDPRQRLEALLIHVFRLLQAYADTHSGRIAYQ